MNYLSIFSDKSLITHQQRYWLNMKWSIARSSRVLRRNMTGSITPRKSIPIT